jgi:hypothetical protein
MTQLLDRPHRKRPFARADILSRLGETIYVEEPTPATPPRPQQPTRQRTPCEEEPERWDGLA